MFDFILLGLILITNLAIIVFVLIRTSNKKNKYLFSVLSFSYSIWLIMSFLSDESFSIEQRLLLMRWDYTLAIVPVYFFLIFALNFPKIIKNAKRNSILLLLPAVAFGI